MRVALRALERLLLPNACVSCERLVEPGRADELICTVCRSRLQALPAGCSRCRQPEPPVGPCRFCRDWPPALRWVRSAVWLGEEARQLIHHMKYEGYPALARAAAQIVTRTMPKPNGACLVPVPLGSKRLARRGYNQAALLARALAARWQLPVEAGLLRRVRETRSQTALAPDERRDNVAGAFSAPPAVGRCGGGAAAASAVGPGGGGGGVAIILIDDVLTTGATLVAAAHALEEAGWDEIGAVTFARAMPYAQGLSPR
ncbi:MAG: ComF family protein [Gemmatimonadales bacterium]